MRLEYQKKMAVGRYILNIGCGDLPVNFGPNAINLDIDWWDVPNFIHANCTTLPFGDKWFDCAVLGDVLEHCTLPGATIMEAARVAKRLVMTIPEEVSLPSVGQHVAIGVAERAKLYRLQHKLDRSVSDDDVIDFHKKTCPHFIKSTPESVIAHDGHINRFDEELIKQLIRSTRMRIVDYRKEPELTWFNWLITLED
jgi:ubiquinone/menaquinone biosynthesis C-methylase UbiE